MSTTLVFILNYETPELTDALYESLLSYQNNIYDVHINFY